MLVQQRSLLRHGARSHRGVKHPVPSRRVANLSTTSLAAQRNEVELVATVAHLLRWLQANGAPDTSKLEPKRFKGDTGQRVGLIAAKDVHSGEILLEIPESLCVTSIDAEKHELVGPVAKDCSELVGLTLWLMAERAKGPASPWCQLLQTLPDTTLSPILWADQDRVELLTGSPVVSEARNRQAALQQQWNNLSKQHLQPNSDKFNPEVFNEADFMRTFCVVLACTAYLPSAECFALVPVATHMGRTGNDNGCTLDYDAARQSVVFKTTRPYREGQEVLVNDGRSNGELLLSTGTLQDNNISDCLYFPAVLVPTDRYFGMKQQLMESFGFTAQERFPVYADRFPIQLLSYLRLSRIQDPGLFAKVNFEQDVVITQMNEYEVLQLLMGDCRESLAAYKTSLEEDTKLLQRPEIPGRERLAIRLRLCEKQILSQSMDAVRRRLAPIRGIPTKSGGMSDPNADLKEVFDFIDDLPNKPKKFLNTIGRWAKGDFDPDWNKK